MESKQQTMLVWQTFVCLLYFIVFFNGISANTEPEIVSTENEIITYTNHTAKLSCIIRNRNRQHVTWSRVTYVNESRKITDLLYVDLLKYTPLSRYHLTQLVDPENREFWNLEIRQVHSTDQGYYSCVVSSLKPISKVFHIRVIENPRNLSLALRSTMDNQQQGKEQTNSALSLVPMSLATISSFVFILMNL
ncbi:unnamed protein product [Adineta ricciae]|uniref:Ig-like domain-containing protein n=1 Tax=Adineta ricciae TaxID=249248 RepID=A0A816CTU6_ADIRI|nr:unnamed protein product [Adineta ricciae]